MKRTILQHEPLRIPQGWTGQDRALVIQLERILDDLYMRFGKLSTDIDGKADKADVVTDVAFDDTNKRITMTINGTTNVVVTAESFKRAMAPFTWGDLANR